MIKIGLTGGVGSGKSTVAKYFSQLGAPIIDADEISHELTKPGSSLHKKIIKHFGEEILSKNRQIDRKKLGKLVFSDQKQRLWLENLIHPSVRKQINKNIKLLKLPYCIIAIPLLFETKFPPKIDKILVIDCPKNMQIQRVCKRNQCSINQAKAMVSAQISRKERLLRANNVICNTKSLLELKKMVKRMHDYYLSMFEAKNITKLYGK